MNNCPFCARQARAVDDLVSRVNRLVHEANLERIRHEQTKRELTEALEALHLTRQSLVRYQRQCKAGGSQ